MVTRQSSPSFLLRYQALIRPPGPPPTIARSSIFLPRFPEIPRQGIRSKHPTTSAFEPEGKMNKAISCVATRKKTKKGRLAPAFCSNAVNLPSLLFRLRRGPRLCLVGGGHDGSLL